MVYKVLLIGKNISVHSVKIQKCVILYFHNVKIINDCDVTLGIA